MGCIHTQGQYHVLVEKLTYLLTFQRQTTQWLHESHEEPGTVHAGNEFHLLEVSLIIFLLFLHFFIRFSIISSII